MITLKSKILITEPYKGQSKFDFWKELRPRDIVELSLKIKNPGRNSRGNLYATDIELINLDNSYNFKGTITEISKYLDKVEYEEII